MPRHLVKNGYEYAYVSENISRINFKSSNICTFEKSKKE